MLPPRRRRPAVASRLPRPGRLVAPVAAVLLAGALLGGALADPARAAGTAPQRTWNFDQIGVPAARAPGAEGAGVVVAVLDSWVDAGHMDFEGRVLPGADCIGGTCRNGPAPRDSCDHGTHVAGTVASSSFGVAPRARILPVRVLTYDPTSKMCVGTPDDVAAGIRWAVTHGARILNLSLGPDVPGLTTSTTIPAAVKEAAARDVVVVFSAGNSSEPMTTDYGEDALVVAATARSGQLAGYSQRGSGVDLAAPGGEPKTPDTCTQSDCVTSLYPGNRYAVAAGTSMAAPHVSGVAALLLGQDPSRSRAQVFDRLRTGAQPLPGAGAGRVDAAAALGVSSAPPTASPRGSTRPAGSPAPPASPPGRSASPRPTLSVIPAPSPRVSAPVAVPVSPVPTLAPTPAASPAPAALPDRSAGDGGAPLPRAPLVAAGALAVAVAAAAAATALLRRRG